MTGADLEAVRTWLVAQAGLTAVTMKIGPMTDDSDKLIGIRDYPGPETENWRADLRCQIRCRGRKPQSGVSPFQDVHDLAELVIAAVAPDQDDYEVIDLANSRRARIRLLGSGVSMGPDQKGREEIAVNIALETVRG